MDPCKNVCRLSKDGEIRAPMIKPACLISSKYYGGFLGFFGVDSRSFRFLMWRYLAPSRLQERRWDQAGGTMLWNQWNNTGPQREHAWARTKQRDGGDRFCILEKLPKKADVYEKPSTRENMEQSGDQQSSFLVMLWHETTGKLLPLERSVTDVFGEQHKHKPALAHNVVNIAVKEPSERLAPASADSGLFFFLSSPSSSSLSLSEAQTLSSPDIRGSGKILKETNHVKWG